MSYESRVAGCLMNPSERQLIALIVEVVDTTETHVKAKETAICGLAQLYVNLNTPERIESILTTFGPQFEIFSKPRMAKIVKSLVDYIAKVPASERLQIALSKKLIEWCIVEKRNYLKHRIELKLAALHLEVDEPGQASAIIDPILIEVRKADDKLLLVELYLLESKINYKVKNFAKAKASLTASRANANNVYCQPAIMAEIDLMSGILYAQDLDYKTSYSYFYEALEPLISIHDARAVFCFKYMIVCKIMIHSKEDVNYLLNGKFGLKFSADPHIQAVKAVADSHFNSSIVSLTKVLAEYKPQIEDDEVVSCHTKLLYDTLLEKNLFKIIISYTRVDIAYIAKKLFLSNETIERKLSEMILDKKILGTLDQSRGCLILYHEQKKQKLYEKSSETMTQLLTVVHKLTEASTTLKKAN